MDGRLEEGRPMERFGLRNDQWERIKDVLPGREGHVGGTAEDNRLFVEAVLYRFRTGCPSCLTLDDILDSSDEFLHRAIAVLSRLATGLSALAPAQRAGAQRLCELARICRAGMS